MRVLLVNPWTRRLVTDAVLPPLGLAFLAGAARGAGHEVEILDLNLGDGTDKHLPETLARFRPDLVGITALTVNIKKAWSVAEAVKGISGNVAVVMGGVHPTLNPRQSLENPSVDYVVVGEGEETIVDLLDCLRDGKRPGRVPGIAFRSEGGVIITERRPLITPLDRIPIPAYDLFRMERYSTPQSSSRTIGVMFTSRGCPFRCIFCDANIVHGRGYRFHSPERVVEEILLLKELFNVDEIAFKDSEFTLNKGRIEALCGLIREKKIRIKWTCNARVGSVDVKLLGSMKAAGCRLIQYGIESGDQSVLDGLKKNITITQIEEAFRLTRGVGIRTIANCMVGSPGETRQGVEKTLALVKRIRPDYINVNFITPFPGTELHRLAGANSWFLNEYNPLDMGQDRCVMNATSMETAELRTLVRYLERSFYLRPSYLLKRALSLNPVEWKKNLAGAMLLLGRSGRGREHSKKSGKFLTS